MERQCAVSHNEKGCVQQSAGPIHYLAFYIWICRVELISGPLRCGPATFTKQPERAKSPKHSQDRWKDCHVPTVEFSPDNSIYNLWNCFWKEVNNFTGENLVGWGLLGGAKKLLMNCKY
jgi:hypothetical protein